MSDATRVSLKGRVRAGGWVAWTAWLLLGCLACAGLRHYRIDNAIDSWMPHLRSIGPYGSYAVIGWPAQAFAEGEIERRVRELPCVALSLDRASVRAAGLLADLSATDLVVGRDGAYAGMICFSFAGTGDDSFVRQIREALSSAAVGSEASSIAIGGPAPFHDAMNDWSQRRMPFIMAAIAAAGLLLLRWAVGEWRTALAGIAAVTLSQLVLLGAVGWSGRPVDMSLSMVPPLIMALGLSYVAQRSLRRDAGRVLLWCGLTTIAGIGGFVTSDLPPVRWFAIYGMAGVVLVWLAVASLVPMRRRVLRGKWLCSAQGFVALMLANRRREVLLGSAALAALALAAAERVRVGAEPLEYFPASAAIVRDFEVLDRQLTGMLPFQLQVTGKFDPLPMLANSPGVRKTIDITPFSGASAATATRTFWCLADNDALETLETQVPRWQQQAERAGSSLHWRGVAAQMSGARQALTRTAWQSLAMMGLVAGAATWVVSRSLRQSLCAAWAAALPVAGLVAAVALMGWTIDLPALMIGAIAVGVSIDDTMHLSSTYGRRRNVRRTLLECWRPSLGSSLVTAACLLLFLISPFGPTRQFGLLLAMAISFGAVANHVVFLAMIGPAARRRAEATTYEGLVSQPT